MEGMDIVLVVLLLVVVGAAAALAGVELTRRRAAATAAVPQPALDEVVQAAVAGALGQAIGELRQANAEQQAEVMHAALRQAAVLQSEQLGAVANQARAATAADLESKKELIDSRLAQVHAETRRELTELRELVSKLAASSFEKFGQVDTALRSHAETTQVLAEQARALKEAMASPVARGQWGERMAEDVLRLAGFLPDVQYRKQSQLEGASGRPDYTFLLPKGQELYMDVKFPLAAYLRYLEAGTEAERQAHRKQFLNDVRARVKELAKRDYARESGNRAVDYVLLFLPNEQLTGFIFEHDSTLIDEAMAQRVVMCSPLTLFAFLGIIRQAHDNFIIEETSDQILGLLGKFAQQWGKYTDALDKVERQFDSAHRAFADLNGTRRRALERPLQQIENLRRERLVAVDGQLFELPDGERTDEADATPPNVRRLGA